MHSIFHWSHGCPSLPLLTILLCHSLPESAVLPIETMSATGKSIAGKGVQNFRDLFRWGVKTTFIDQNGKETYTYSVPTRPPNPFHLLKMLSIVGWGAYIVGFLAWTADAFDFHALSIQTTKLAAHFHVSKTTITQAITLTLLLRSVGATIFGVISDYFGRKYVLVVNMFILAFLQIGSIYCKTFHQFLAVRSLFGLGMGGVYGAAAGMALENIPAEARGLFSGMFQQGYSFGYVLAACVNLGVGGATESWRTLFWVGAGLSFASGCLRLVYPESRIFLESRKNLVRGEATRNFCQNFSKMLKKHWLTCIYAIILMSWFNWLAHSSQDSYTTFMLRGKQLSNSAASRASILMKTGACVGGTVWGYMSQWIGRRRAMILACMLCLCLIPAWVLPTTESGLEAGGFFFQFMVQGAYGVVPVYLSEISPPAFRAIFVGLTYQLGNAISSPSTQMINAISEDHFIVNHKGKRVEAYGPVMAIATVIISIGLIITAAFGPEKIGINFEEGGVATEGLMQTLSVDEKAKGNDLSTVSIEQIDSNRAAKEG